MKEIRKDIEKARAMIESLNEQLDYDQQCRECFEWFCEKVRSNTK